MDTSSVLYFELHVHSHRGAGNFPDQSRQHALHPAFCFSCQDRMRQNALAQRHVHQAFPGFSPRGMFGCSAVESDQRARKIHPGRNGKYWRRDRTKRIGKRKPWGTGPSQALSNHVADVCRTLLIVLSTSRASCATGGNKRREGRGCFGLGEVVSTDLRADTLVAGHATSPCTGAVGAQCMQRHPPLRIFLRRFSGKRTKETVSPHHASRNLVYCSLVHAKLPLLTNIRSSQSIRPQ